MRQEFDCGIQRERIVSWLNSELNLPREGDAWVFTATDDAPGEAFNASDGMIESSFGPHALEHGETVAAPNGESLPPVVQPHEAPTCFVTVSPLPNRTMGTISLERTLITMTGNDRAFDELNRLFTLRFMSAGG